jgi:hypothetical protein
LEYIRAAVKATIEIFSRKVPDSRERKKFSIVAFPNMREHKTNCLGNGETRAFIFLG